jgi:3-methyladenine DNA glycosylase AlkD
VGAVPSLVDTLLGRLESRFETHRDTELARSASKYMRDLFPFYGIQAPLHREIARDVAAGLPRPTEAQLRRMCLACWRRPEREWQYFACGYLRRHVEVCSARFLTTVERLITSKPWWDTVDSLASRAVGPLVRRHPQLVSDMDRWISSDDIWIARTALLHQLHYKQDTDADRLFRYCSRRAGDPEFFIRKAIGWALREYSKTDAKAVRAFVRKHGRELSGLSRREALKWLERRGEPRRSKP